MPDLAVSYYAAVTAGVTAAQYAEWNGRKLWACVGGYREVLIQTRWYPEDLVTLDVLESGVEG